MPRQTLALVLALLILATSMTLTAGGRRPAASSLLPEQDLVEVHLVTPDGTPVRLDHATSMQFHDGALYVVEARRHQFEGPYDGTPRGRLLRVDLVGSVGVVRVLATGLADPLGLAVDQGGSIFVTEYERVRVLRGADWSIVASGLPTMSPDTTYLPGSDENDLENALQTAGLGDLQDFRTTGTMGLVPLGDGSILATQGIHGRPPDDPLLGDRDYEVDLSSSILRLREGESPIVVARGCRNCYDLAIAPQSSPYAGRTFATENMDAYRLRLQSGSHRTLLEGSTPADVGVLDALVEVDSATGRVRRVATVPPDGPSGAAVPTGMAFAPAAFSDALAGLPIVALYGGDYTDAWATPFRGYVVAMIPDDAGVGVTLPIAQGLTDPIDVTFAPDGALYVLEYKGGRLYRVAPEP